MIKKKIILYQGGRYFYRNKTYNYFKNILSDYVVDMYENVLIFGKKEFFYYDTAIFFSQFGELTDKQEKNILGFISSGKGLIGLHGASASFKTHPKYYEMLGGRFISHKRFREFDVKILDKNHPITQGLEDFRIKDEPYRHDFSMGRDIYILAEGNYYDKNDPKPEPIIWIKTYGKGRIFFCALGHKAKSLKNENYQIIIKRAVKWVLEGQ